VANRLKKDGTRVPASEIADQLKHEAEVRARVQDPKVMRTPWQKPEFLADEFPNGYTKVQLHSKWPGHQFLRRLAKIGYPHAALFSCVAHSPFKAKAPKKRNGGAIEEFLDPQHPYIASAPTRRTTQGGSLTPAQVSAALSQMRVEINMQGAVFEVLVKRRLVPEVSASRGLNPITVQGTVARVRKKIA
jgi:hypothetical protein